MDKAVALQSFVHYFDGPGSNCITASWLKSKDHGTEVSKQVRGCQRDTPGSSPLCPSIIYYFIISEPHRTLGVNRAPGPIPIVLLATMSLLCFFKQSSIIVNYYTITKHINCMHSILLTNKRLLLLLLLQLCVYVTLRRREQWPDPRVAAPWGEGCYRKSPDLA